MQIKNKLKIKIFGSNQIIYAKVIKLSGIDDYINKFLSAKKITIIACGTSWHSALVAEYMFEKIARIPTEVEYASEFRYRDPVIERNDIIIAISQSGETADTLAAIKLAKSKGAFVGCPKGWGCYNVNANLFRAFEMDKKGWILVNPGSASGLDGSIARTIERGQNWFGYYWAPTSLVGKYNLKNIDFGVSYAGNMNWDRCMVKSQINCQNPKKTSWVKSEVFTLTNKNMSNKPNI